MASPPSIVIAAGGTGGHIYPGLALAAAIQRAQPNARLLFVGTARGLETKLIPDAGYELALVDMVPFAGQSMLRLPLALVRSTAQAWKILRDAKASVAVGMGGYASIPLMLAAKPARVPGIIHESGAIPGRANLLAARITPNVAIAFHQAKRSFSPRVETRTVGMPLDAALSSFNRSALRTEARAAFGLKNNVTMVMVNGGSQGAASLNRLAVGLAQRWRDRSDIRILLKAGAAHEQAVAAELEANGGTGVVELTRYIERMDYAYAAADFAICRAGAGTIAELAVVGLPAILIPYPHAPYDHQAVNAQTLVDEGGAIMIRDHEALPERVGPILDERLANPSALLSMQRGLHAIARPHAADELAAWVLELTQT